MSPPEEGPWVPRAGPAGHGHLGTSATPLGRDLQLLLGTPTGHLALPPRPLLLSKGWGLRVNTHSFRGDPAELQKSNVRNTHTPRRGPQNKHHAMTPQLQKTRSRPQPAGPASRGGQDARGKKCDPVAPLPQAFALTVFPLKLSQTYKTHNTEKYFLLTMSHQHSAPSPSHVSECARPPHEAVLSATQPESRGGGAEAFRPHSSLPLSQ